MAAKIAGAKEVSLSDLCLYLFFSTSFLSEVFDHFMLKTLLSIHNLPKMMACRTMGVIFCILIFLLLVFSLVHFVSFKTLRCCSSRDRALKFGSLSLCAGIFIFTIKFAYAHKTLCIIYV